MTDGITTMIVGVLNKPIQTYRNLSPVEHRAEFSSPKTSAHQQPTQESCAFGISSIPYYV